MNLNIFEGGRRLTKLIQVCVALSLTGYALYSNPNGAKTYLIYNAKPEFINQDFAPTKCNYDDDLVVNVVKDLPVTGETKLRLCFVAMEFENRGLLIPYKVDEQTDIVWGDTKTSQNVLKFVAEQKKAIKEAYLNDIKDSEDWWSAKIGAVISFLIASVIACGFIGLISKIIGWITRGFMNVPSGQDFASSEISSEAGL